MADIIPALNKSTLARMTRGEKRFAHRLQHLLEDDYLVWHDIPVGKLRRYPDFIILHPSRGLLFLEVKDWKPDTLKRISKTRASLLTSTGKKETVNPLEQARQCMLAVVNMLAKDPQLQQHNVQHQGNLILPYAWGVVLTNISRKAMHKAIPDESARDNVLPDRLVIYKEDMLENTDAEVFQQHLWGMFSYHFGGKLSLPQIDRIRWHLFPEIRINHSQQDLFSDDNDDAEPQSIPDIIKILDLQQEQLARSLGNGHRVIHGVAGSGKTLILGYRCIHLAQHLKKPILVLCYNITLAAKLRGVISAKGIEDKVQVYHFHDWCALQLKTYHAPLLDGSAAVYERQVESVISGVESGLIPRAQYGALMIDEGHDFEAEWLKLVVQMIDPESDSLLLLYDDAQTIYRRKTGLDFSLSSVGIKAQGRTTILRLNYRNTREILSFAYKFAQSFLLEHLTDEDHIPLIPPEAAGANGPIPELRHLGNLKEELNYTVRCLKKWAEHGLAWNDISILICNTQQGAELAKLLEKEAIPYLFMRAKKQKLAYDENKNCVNILSLHSSKGLEFKRVIIVGIGHLKEQNQEHHARLLYVGMTRAQETLLLTTSKMNSYVERLCA